MLVEWPLFFGPSLILPENNGRGPCLSHILGGAVLGRPRGYLLLLLAATSCSLRLVAVGWVRRAARLDAVAL